MNTILGTVYYLDKAIEIEQDNSEFEFDFYLKYVENGLNVKVIQSSTEILPKSKQIFLNYIKQFLDSQGNIIGTESKRVPMPQPTEFDKWLNYSLTDFDGTASDFYFNSAFNGMCADLFEDVNIYPFNPYSNFSLSQPIIFNTSVVENTVTCNIQNIGDGQIPAFKINGLTNWQSSNVFENVPNGTYTVLVKSDVRLWESKKVANVNFQVIE